MAMSDDLGMVGEIGELIGKSIKTGGYGCGRLQFATQEGLGV